jgi:coenzyme F420 hydrogenase subunit beta
MQKNISFIVNNGLCMGCGLCQDSCHKKCIKIQHKKGINIPAYVNKNLCNQCGICVKVCPGKGCDIGSLSEKLFDDRRTKQDTHVGKYISCYAGYSNDYDIRYNGASGGMVSQILIYLLEKKIITGAAVVGFKQDEPLTPYVYIAKTKEQILAAQSSKYCTVSYETTAQQILNTPGKYVVVGLPCLIQGFRNYENTFKLFKERVIGYFALYCSATKNIYSQDYLLYRYQINRQNISSFTYRGEGCMGSMIAKNKTGNKLIEIELLKYYVPLRGFFNISRCALCIDHYGELADVAFGDIHIGEFLKDNIGISSWVSRNRYWDNVIKQISDEGFISMKEIDIELLKKSQKYCFKHKKGKGIVAAFTVHSFLGKKNPEYDIPFLAGWDMKFVIREFINIACRFIGRHKSLWWIIKMLDKNYAETLNL